MINKIDYVLEIVLSAWAKRAANTLGLLIFTMTYASADFGPQQIITSSATEVIDAFPADMDGDGDIDVSSRQAQVHPLEGAASSFIVIMEMAVLRSSIIDSPGVQRLL